MTSIVQRIEERKEEERMTEVGGEESCKMPSGTCAAIIVQS